jgi:uncharacterized protein
MNFKRHHMPDQLFVAIAAGGGGPEAVEILTAAQHSKHALLLHGVAMIAARSGDGQADLARRGYGLLASAQCYDPDAVATLIRHPSVGAWALRTMVALRGGPVMPGAKPSGLATVAAAAAIRARVPAEIEVPVTGGTVMLPSLGAAGPIDADVAMVRRSAGCTEVSGRSEGVVIPANYSEPAPGWRPLRRVLTAPFELLADDLDPFRMPAASHLVQFTDLDRWGPVFQAAWTLLDRHHPAVAHEVASMIKVIVPLAKPTRGQASSSSPETFGAVALSDPVDPRTLASTLTHEVQHVKLSALLDVHQLTHPDDDCRFYAPWREDPRPVSGLLQGTYAYLGVTGFWRRQRELETGMDAHVEFARWREAAALATTALQSSGLLTTAGEHFVRGMTTTLAAWQDEEVPELARQRAAEENARHLARWRSEHGSLPVP